MTPLEIIEESAAAFGVSPESLLQPTRENTITEARAVSMALMAESGMHYKLIGKFHKRHRTTVNHAMKKVQNLSEVYPSFALTLSTLRKKLKGKEK